MTVLVTGHTKRMSHISEHPVLFETHTHAVTPLLSNVENVLLPVLEKVPAPHCLFCPTKSPNPKDIHFTITFIHSFTVA